jgi:nitrate/nitrite-specific signal transduction histidine kinase
MILSRPKDTLDDDDAKPALVSEKNSLAIFQTVETDTQALKKKSDDIITAYDNGDLDSAKRKYEEIDGLFSGFSVTFEDMMTDNMGEIDSIMKTVDTVQEVAQKWIMVLFGAIVLLELMFSLLNSSIIARELSDVQNVVEKVLKGDLKKRIKITAKDEVGDLARAFNQMIAKLQESYASLEKKVKIRTKELEESRVGVEKEVQARTKELDKTVDVLERTTSVMTDRELKMIELKKRIKELEEKNALLANKK